jgi:uncharacterized lipoprotein YajG
MRFRKTSFLVAAIALIAGCAARADQTDPTTIDGLKGRTLRVVHPGEMITMDCRMDRVTVTVDEHDKITNVNFC